VKVLEEYEVCGCGNCQKALDGALGELQTLLKGDECLHWYAAQVTSHLLILTILRSLVDTGKLDPAFETEGQAVSRMLADPLSVDYATKQVVAILQQSTTAEVH
jgi:hypothetical protein